MDQARGGAQVSRVGSARRKTHRRCRARSRIARGFFLFARRLVCARLSSRRFVEKSQRFLACARALLKIIFARAHAHHARRGDVAARFFGPHENARMRLLFMSRGVRTAPLFFAALSTLLTPCWRAVEPRSAPAGTWLTLPCRAIAMQKNARPGPFAMRRLRAGAMQFDCRTAHDRRIIFRSASIEMRVAEIKTDVSKNCAPKFFVTNQCIANAKSICANRTGEKN